MFMHPNNCRQILQVLTHVSVFQVPENLRLG